jgi:hypothetical protein
MAGTAPLPWTPQDWEGSWLVIPDLHGDALRWQAAWHVAQQHPAARLAFLGDLIDDAPRRREARKWRAEPGQPDDSREILEAVRHLVEAGRAEVLLGNHEVMAAASVLDDHRPLMDVWWRVGGREAAASCGWNGKSDAGQLAQTLLWWREHARLWLTVGPPGAQVLLSHATRPTPERWQAGQNRAPDLIDQADDPVVWFPLGSHADNGAHIRSLPLLPGGVFASLHGHMETPELWTLLDSQDQPAYQLDLHPRLGKLALMHISPLGKLRSQVVSVKP